MNILNVERRADAEAGGRPVAERDIYQIISAFRRRLRLFSAIVALFVIGAVLFSFQQTPRYTATSSVMIDTRKRDVTNINEVLSGLPTESSAVDTEVEILKSRSLATRVVQSLRLDQDPEFNSSLVKPTVIGQILGAPSAAVNRLFKASAPVSSASANAAEADLRQKKTFDSVVDAVLADLTVRRSALTFVININFESVNPAKAAQIANTYADDYLLEQLEAKFDATKQASSWLDDRLSQLKVQVEQAESAVAQYRAANGLMSAVGSSLTEQEVSGLNQQLALAQAADAEAEAKVRTARQQLANGSNGDDTAAALDSSVVNGLRAQRAEVSGKLADLSTRYGARHPEVQRVQRQLADIDSQIQLEINRTISNLDAQSQVARQRVASIQGSLAHAKGTLAGNNEASVKLAELERNATSVSTLYESFLNRFKETTTQQGMEESDSRVVSHAKIPRAPSYPKKGLDALIGMLAGILAGAGAIMLAEALDSGIATSEDIERLFGVASLGSVPLLSSTGPSTLSPAELIIEKPLSAFAEAFRNLRTSIIYSRVDKTVRVIAVTSALPGEGKTTTAFCLGRTMAMSGARTVVVDCDVRRRNINRLLGDEPTVGLMEVLAGTATLDQALMPDRASGTWFLPLARSSFTPKDLFGGAAMANMMAELKKRFEFIILDTAPVIPVADTRSLAPKADVVVFLTQWRKTPRKAVQSAFELLNSVGADIAGIALTQVDVREQAKYGYGDAGYYYRSYRKYYAQ